MKFIVITIQQKMRWKHSSVRLSASECLNRFIGQLNYTFRKYKCVWMQFNKNKNKKKYMLGVCCMSTYVCTYHILTAVYVFAIVVVIFIYFDNIISIFFLNFFSAERKKEKNCEKPTHKYTIERYSIENIYFFFLVFGFLSYFICKNLL